MMQNVRLLFSKEKHETNYKSFFSGGDHLGLIKIYEAYNIKNNKKNKIDFCLDNHLRYIGLKRAVKNCDRLVEQLKLHIRIDRLQPIAGREGQMEEILASAYYENTLMHINSSLYQFGATTERIHLYHTSNAREEDCYVICLDIFQPEDSKKKLTSLCSRISFENVNKECRLWDGVKLTPVPVLISDIKEETKSITEPPKKKMCHYTTKRTKITKDLKPYNNANKTLYQVRCHDAQINIPTKAVQSEEIDPSFEHPSRCDRCTVMIKRLRYKCRDCKIYDVCSECIVGVADFHPGHEFILMTNDSYPNSEAFSLFLLMHIDRSYITI